MGQKNSKTSTGDTVPQPSGRAETNPDQQSVDGISEAPRRKVGKRVAANCSLHFLAFHNPRQGARAQRGPD